MLRRPLALLLLVTAACARAPAAPVDAGRPAAAPPPPPTARATPTVVELHGVRLDDEFAWMKAKGTPELEAHLAAENRYTDAVLAPLRPLQDALAAELRGRLKEDDESVHAPLRGYDYWSRTRVGQPYATHWRAPRDGGAEALLLDLNAEADGGAFLALGDFEVSDDDRRLAWSVDRSGFREYTLAVKDLATGALLDEPIEHVTSTAWSADGRALFYVVEDEAKREYRLYRHTLGAPRASDVLVYEETDERFALHVGRSSSGRFLLLTAASQTTSEVRLVEAARPTAPFRVVWPRVQGRMYDVDDVGDRLLIRVNDTGRTFRIVSVPAAAPAKGRPVEVVPMREDVMIEGFQATARFLLLAERVAGLPRLRALDLRTKVDVPIDAPEGDAWLWLEHNEDFQATTVRYGLTSLVTPTTIFERDLVSGRTRVLKQQLVPGYDPARYETLRLEATAADGTTVPISIARRKGLTGPAPLLLHAYGAYGDNNDPFFQSGNVSLLDRGVVIAEAHLRGGGEFGKRWHDDGRMAKKMNTFTDFIACAEHLVREGWTTKDQLVISGASAGGLLMGAVLNLRPDLFRAAFVEVPFVDVINTMLDERLPLTVGEFEEWGNPTVKAEFEAMLAYSPYDNVKAQAYPAILVRSAYNDSQVLYHEPAKWVARLRARKTDQNPLLLWMEMSPAGHFGRSDRYQQLGDDARSLAFMLWQWGLTR
jgi:oligopeptidase B